jgi:hypothetical protein
MAFTDEDWAKMGNLMEVKVKEVVTTAINSTEYKKFISDAVAESTVISSLKESVRNLELEVSRLKMDSLFQQNEWRRKRIIFHGLDIIKTSTIAEVNNKVSVFLENTLKIQGIKLYKNTILNQKDAKCSVLCSFGNISDTTEILKQGRQLKGTNISMQLDLSPEQRLIKKVLLIEKKKLSDDIEHTAKIWADRYLIIREKASGQEWFNEVLDGKIVKILKIPNYQSRKNNPK